MATPRALATEIKNLLTFLIEAEIALYINPVVELGGQVTWGSSRPPGKLTTGTRAVTSLEYRNWLDSGAYSVLLFDGALLQLSYHFDGRQLTAHRLAYVPPPFEFDRDLLLREEPVDLFDVYADGPSTDVVLRTVVRFDFDRFAAEPGHPASHLTINSADCRIACASPMGAGRFFDFVFRHFYPHLYDAHPYLHADRSRWDESTLTTAERETPHISWRIW